MASAEQTTTQKPADWSEYPEYEKFWLSYVDIFWGEGGNTSYHDLLLENEAWLKDVYLQNNTNLTELEKGYIKSVSGATGEYLKGMDKGELSVGVGGPRTSFVPASTQRSLDKRMEAQLMESYEKYTTGQGQAGRIKEIGEKFTPAGPEIRYMEALRGEGEKGQALRTGMPTTTAEADVDPGTAADVGNVVGLGAGVYEFMKKNPEILSGIGSAGTSIWDTGSGFMDYMIDDFDWSSGFGGNAGGGSYFGSTGNMLA